MRDIFFLFLILFIFPVICYAEEPSHLPMYGGIDRSINKELLQKDSLFIANATHTFGTREHASQGYTERGFDLYIEEKLDKAMERFNEAWLLDPNNPYVYLGYAVIQKKQKKYCISNSMFKIANDKGLTESGFLADYALTAALCASIKPDEEKEALFTLSNNLHEQALQTPNQQLQAYAYHSWAKSYLLQNDISNTKLMIEKASALNGKIDPALLKAINYDSK